MRVSRSSRRGSTTVEDASGACMPSLRAATDSMRLFVAHVLCSSWSCVHSSFSFCAAACAPSSSLKTRRARCCEVITASAHATANASEQDVQARHLSSSPRPSALRCGRAGFASTSASEGRMARPIAVSCGGGRSFARTGTPRGRRSAVARSRMKFFTMRSSSEWKLTTASRPPGVEQVRGLGQRHFQLFKLLIDVNPKSLKGAGRRVLARLARTDRATHDLGKLPRRANGLDCPCRNNRCCNLFSKPFLPVVRDDLPQRASLRRDSRNRPRSRRGSCPCACRAGRRA